MNKLRETITSRPFFNGMKPAHLDIVVHGAREVKFEAGAMLFREREPANRFFLIQKGKVLLEAHNPAGGTVPVQEVGVGDGLGWSWLYPPYQWQFTARAIEPVEAVALGAASLREKAEENHTSATTCRCEWDA